MKNLDLHVKGTVNLSFEAVKWLYISVMLIFPCMAFVYPVLLPNANDPFLLRIAITICILLVFLLARNYEAVQLKINYYTILLYYLITAHTFYLIYSNHMAAEYVIGLAIIIGIGHIIFSNFKQVAGFLAFLTVMCLMIMIYVEDPTMNPFTFLVSIFIIGVFTLISLNLRFSFARTLLTSSLIIENVNEGIISVNMDDIVSYTNDKIQNIIGYSQEELMNKDIKDFLADDKDRRIVLDNTAKRKAGISDKYELDFIHKDGRRIRTEISATPIYDNNGIANGSVALITDITSRKEVEEELKRQSLIANKTDSIVILTNAQDQIEYVNESFEKYTGYNLNDVRGREVIDFLHGAETDQNTVNSIQEKKYSGNSFSAEIKNYTKDKKPIWISINVTPLKDNNNEVTGWITIGNDTTVKKKAEEKLRLEAFRLATTREIDATIIASETVEELANNTIGFLKKLLPPEAEANISIKNDDGSYSMITKEGSYAPPCSQLSPEAVQGLTNGIPYEIRDLKKQKELTAIEKGLLEKGFTSYVLIPLVYGKELMGSINIYWYKYNSKSSEFIEMTKGVTRDLAIGIKQVSLQQTITIKNDQLYNRLQELEETHEELRSFSYIVSHDLKAPLRAIGSLAHWLNNDYKDKLDDSGKEYLNLLVGRTNRLHQLIEGILEYSRIGRKNLEKTLINTSELVINTIDLILVKDNIEITVDMKMPLIKYNQIQLSQIFQNLIQNAVKFIDKPKGTVDIGCNENKTHYEFFVKDNGPGIKPKYFDKVFKMFQTLHTRDDVESTGVGLSIVKKIAEVNGGQVWIDSESESGTCVKFSVPK